MYYDLHTSDMYLEEIDYTEDKLNSIKFTNRDNQLKAIIKDFDTAVEIRRIVFIELGIELKIEKIKVFGKEDK